MIESELKKTKAELTIAKHKEAKLRSQIKGMTEKERRHRSIVWGNYGIFAGLVKCGECGSSVEPDTLYQIVLEQIRSCAVLALAEKGGYDA